MPSSAPQTCSAFARACCTTLPQPCNFIAKLPDLKHPYLSRDASVRSIGPSQELQTAAELQSDVGRGHGGPAILDLQKSLLSCRSFSCLPHRVVAPAKGAGADCRAPEPRSECRGGEVMAPCHTRRSGRRALSLASIMRRAVLAAVGATSHELICHARETQCFAETAIASRVWSLATASTSYTSTPKLDSWRSGPRYSTSQAHAHAGTRQRELSRAMRGVFRAVHPDLFHGFPAEQAVNQKSFQARSRGLFVHCPRLARVPGPSREPYTSSATELSTPHSPAAAPGLLGCCGRAIDGRACAWGLVPR